MNKTEISGLTILFVGVALLIFTFLNAYWFLTQNLSLISTSDLVEAFGKALAPLIATCIRIMYLGIMGWIGSLLTLRGISLLRQREVTKPADAGKKSQQKAPAPIKKIEKAPSSSQPQTKAEPQKIEKTVESPPSPPPPSPSSEIKNVNQPVQEAPKTSGQFMEKKEEEEKSSENADAKQEVSGP
ncbi:hypothetical protein DRO54_02240 [Candidatus Bathyarchaeota archaeon]|nr:MAG: hypothetical protein DRO54_02240 [Candidatus Bathyarchaeota archaeon]